MGSTSETDAELHDRIHQQEVVVELGQQALETDDIEQFLCDAAKVVAETLDAEYCKILELRPGDDELRLSHGVGWQEGLVGTATVPTGTDSQAGYTLRTDEPVVVEDLRTEDRFSGLELLTDHGVVSGLSVVIGSSDDPWGVLGVHTTERRAFAEHDINFVRNVSNVLASTIDNRETERRLETEKRVRERVVETSPVGIIVVGADGTLRFANERAEEIYGRTRDELETYTHDDSRWDLVDSHGETLSADETPFGRVLTTGESVFDMEVGLRRPDGQRVWLSVNGTPVELDDEGNAVFAVTDITEQKRLEAEFTEMLGRVSDAFYALDDEFRFTHVNERAEELLQHTEEELLGENLWDVFPSAAEIDEVWDAFQTARDEQVPTSYELYYDTLGFWVEANLYPSETGISVYFRDISDRVQRERALERSNERLERFAYSASHDLQEPLRMVSSYLQLIERRYRDALDEDGEEFLEFAIDGADRMRAMIQSLLEYSRVETRGEPLESVDLETAVTDVIDDLQLRIDEHDADITVEELPRVEGDPGQLRQLFQNLLSNAIQYSGDETPRVHIAAERSDSMWTISVTDEGIGIDPDETGRIFEVFERLHSRAEYSGTGIGLALAQRIVERHGGDIWAESVPGEGATFSFTLPPAETDDR
ncbi:histidine kinase [Halostagnicola larsenii XH-48]|uniref:histidine kinase n=1 Tax=Halostagnicola larsenii XH-48 TaxID=797299 RepID=W0JMR9_9EURY|nr:ATP-binding protein [Halostagnicola larsenii]AHF99883.1 histidine kinase [Halostagnicola larsenii XH-48]